MKYIYICVEGQHDVFAIGRVLTCFHGAKLVKKEEDVDGFWKRLIPKKFPYEGLLLMRVPVPTFYQAKDYSVAIHSANSDSKLASNLENTLLNIDHDKLSAVAIFCDADRKSPQERLNNIISKLTDCNIFENVTHPGQIYQGPPRAGIFVFPDNNSSGNLEDLLLKCAEVSFPKLLEGASAYVAGVEEPYRSAWKESDEKKVVIGCIANVLRPGKANQVSIQDNDWICANTSTIESVSKLNQFIKEIIGD